MCVITLINIKILTFYYMYVYILENKIPTIAFISYHLYVNFHEDITKTYDTLMPSPLKISFIGLQIETET